MTSLVCAGVLLSAIALGATEVRIFPVVPIDVPARAGAELTSALAEELRGLGANVALLSDAAGGGGKAVRSSQALAKAQDQLETAKKQIGEMRFGPGLKALDKAIAGLEEHVDELDRFDDLLDAKLLLAVTLYRRGKERAGADVLAELARLRPDLELSAETYPPAFLKELAAAKARALARKPGTLAIRGARGSATLNGRAMGELPVVVEQVTAGRHFVVVKRGADSWSTRTVIAEGQSVELTPQLTSKLTSQVAGGAALRARIAEGTLTHDLRDRLLSAARKDGGHFLVVAVVSRAATGFRVTTYVAQAEGGAWARPAEIDLDSDLLSIGIEANRLARAVVTLTAAFQPVAADESWQFVAMNTDAAAPVERHVQFAAIVGASPTAPVRAPVAAAPISAASVPTLAGTAAGPVVDETPALEQPAPTKSIQAVRVSGDDPAAALRFDDSDVEVGLFGSWGFWTGVGLVALGVAGGSWYYLTEIRAPTAVTATVTW